MSYNSSNDSFDDQGHGVAAAETKRGETKRFVEPNQRMNERHEQTRPLAPMG